MESTDEALGRIAIVGMSGRFPGAPSVDQFWKNLADGVESIHRFTDAELAASGVDPARLANRSYVPAAPILEQIDAFDAGFFGVSPREAELLDPQHRFFLECAWEALEDAGHTPSAPDVVVGVFASSSISGYLLNNLYGAQDGLDPVDELAAFLGNDKDYLATRVSYKLNLTGPSVMVQTACSSSLVTVCMAYQSLLTHQCDLALAGGVSIRVPHRVGYLHEKGGPYSPDGHCRAFDAEAQGAVFGSGVGVVALKRLEDALKDGDRIHAVLLGAALNNDGLLKVGFTAPSVEGQAAVIQMAHEVAGIQPETITYVEAHGTGTPLGDPIEISALTRAFALRPGRAPSCALGSVKTNVGHLEAAAGIAGLIKTVMALKHRQIPPSLHYRTPNPAIRFAESPFYVNETLKAWDASGAPRRGAVSSFGIGGTNAHVVLEEAPPDVARATAAVRPFLLPISARHPEALGALAGRYRDLIRGSAAPGTSLDDICFTASVRRAHHPRRICLVGASPDEMVEALDAFAAGRESPSLGASGRDQARPPRIVFVFPGHGSQYFGMARGLLSSQPVFREALSRCDKAVRAHTGWSPMAEIEGAAESPMWHRFDYIQPMLFSLHVALAELWSSWGIRPDAVVGHSMGEVAAACVAGALSLDDAARVICVRSRLALRIAGKGGMALTELSADDARALLAGREDRISIAATNGPRSTVLAGDESSLDDVLRTLEQRGVFARRVKVSIAAHSPQVDPILPELTELLRKVAPRKAKVQFYSTVTAAQVAGDTLGAAYWTRNMREPVLFDRAIERLLGDGHDIFLELSPHPLLIPAIEETCRARATTAAVLPSLRRDEPDDVATRRSIAALYSAGAPVDWHALYPDGGRMVDLPSYPWQRERYWIDAVAKRRGSAGVRAGSAASLQLGPGLEPSTRPGERIWEVELGPQDPAYLADHRIEGAVVVPGAFFVDMALAAAVEVFGPEARCLEDVIFDAMLFLPEGETRLCQLVLTDEGSSTASFRISSRSGGAAWTAHATGRVRAAPAASKGASATIETLDARKAGCQELISRTDHYRTASELGVEYGPAFQGVQEIKRRDGEAIGEIKLPETLGAIASSQIHPALLDACFQVQLSVRPAGAALCVPVGIRRLQIHSAPGREARVHATSVAGPPGEASEDAITVYDVEGRLVAEVEGLRVRPLDGASARAEDEAIESWLCETVWRAKELEETPRSGARSGVEDGAPQPGSWLLVSCEPRAIGARDLGEALAERLRANGQSCIVAYPEDVASASPSARSRSATFAPDELRRLVSEALSDSRPCRGVIYLAQTATAGVEDAPTSHLDADVQRATFGLLHIVSALAGAGSPDALRLWTITRGAHVVLGEEPLSVAQTPLWGLARTAGIEHPNLAPTSIDLDPRGRSSATEAGEAEAGEAEALFREIWSRGEERAVALRGRARYVARITRWDAGREPLTSLPPLPPASAADRPFRLRIRTPGDLGALVWAPSGKPAPGPGEVEIEVEAAGLNFIDVLKAMGTYPGQEPGATALGGEASGRITALGEGVSGFQVGDEVVALGSGCLGTTIRTSALLVAHKPPHLRFDEAAGLPIVAMTAVHALHHVGRLKKGERILIHSAATGTGLAAVLLARRLGAEVLATAGSEAKREYLRSLGIRLVMDSRSLTFADEVMAYTKGEGVHVVLNSLSGAALTRSLSVLRPFGRHLELSKRDIYQDRSLGLAPFRKSLSFSAIDLAQLGAADPETFAAIFRETIALFRDREVEPLPVRAFAADAVEDAFRCMAQAAHLGKIVISLADRAAVRLTRTSGGEPVVRRDGTYLITGGLGGLGLAVARWLVAEGARHLVLLGRSDPSVEARAAVEALRQAGAHVELARCDVAREQELSAALARIRSTSPTSPPLRGIIHAAGHLDDGTLLHLTEDRLRAVMAAKVVGSWNLHRLTRDERLDFFVLFSSVVSMIGAAGQASHAAANAFLDGLAHHRRAQGLPALSINWGPWSRIGQAAGREDPSLDSAGFIDPDRGIEVFKLLLSQSAVQVGAMPSLQRLARTQAGSSAGPLLSELTGPEVAASAPHGQSRVRDELTAAYPGDRIRIMEAYLAEQIGQVLRIPAAKIDPTAPISSLGLDSLLALQLRNRMEASLSLEIPVTLIWRYPTIVAMAPYLLGAMELSPPEPAETHVAQGGASATTPADAPDTLSREDLSPLFDEELSAVQRLLEEG